MNIEEKVTSLIVDQLGVEKDKVKPESSFVDDLGADSMDIVELVMAFEDNFSIQIPDQEEGNIRTVQDAIDFIKENQKANS
ncbi:MAG: acyl carrier protein [Bdellovibrionales bacterium]|nr:acyl carrier protein [Bdellovibrionales bacterium]